MATPNDPNLPRKPQGQPPAQPAAGKPAAKPPAGKAPPGKKDAARLSKPVKAGSAASHTGGRKIGQVLIDLGFIDDGQLWEILDEAKNTGVLTGQVAVSRGLITE